MPNSYPAAELVAHFLGNCRREGRGWRCTCPICGGDKPSLSMRDGDTPGRLLVTCWHDCPRADILRELSRCLHLGQSPEWDLRSPVTVPRKPEPDKTDLLEKLWRESLPLQTGDIVDRYMKNRGIELQKLGNNPECLRFHPALNTPVPVLETDPSLSKTYPGLVARFTSADGSMVALHRIYLTVDGSKAPFPKDSKYMLSSKRGASRGSAIKLFEPEAVLGLAEGIETALACFLGFGVPTWSSFSASLLPSVVIPPSVRRVVIFADNDASETGERQARKLAARLLHENIEVKLLLPPVVGRDWLDVYRELKSGDQETESFTRSNESSFLS